MHSNVWHKYFERRSRSPGNAYTDRMPYVQCLRWYFLQPGFFLFLDKPARCRSCLKAKCAHIHAVHLQESYWFMVEIIGSSFAILERRQLGTILIPVGAFTACLLFPTPSTFDESQVCARTRARFPAFLAHYAWMLLSASWLNPLMSQVKLRVRVSLKIRSRVSKLSARTSTSLELSRAGLDGHLACAT